jgi:glutamate decarboxylase
VTLNSSHPSSRRDQILETLASKSLDEADAVSADPNANPVSPEQLIGGTPILDLSAYSLNPNVRILAKTEYLNPSGSIKDRIAQHMLSNAERTGRLKPGMTVVAATSGNTGSAIAMACALRGYEYIVITNEKTSKEKVDSMKAYGGEVLISPSGVPPDHPEHYQNIENRLCEENPDLYYGVDQYNNPFNAEAYEATLGPEIWKQTSGEVTHFIAGGSTGGTVSGTGRYLKSQNADVRVLMADPRGSVFWDHVVNGVAAEDVKVSKGWETEGVGKDSIPGCFDINVVDGMVRATDEHAFRTCREVASNDGLLIGGSSGLNLHAARVLSGQVEDGATIVTVLPDSGVKYLSKIYNDDWLGEMGVETTALCEEGQACGDLYWRPDIVDSAVAPAAAAKKAAKATEGDDLWSRESLEQEMNYLLEIAPQLVDYHVASVSGSERVHSRLQSPDELAATFLEAGAELELKENADPTDMDGIRRAVRAVMDNSVRSSHPLFLNQLYSGIDPVALAAEWLASTLNANVHTFEVAPVLTEIEKAVLAKTARMWLAPGSPAATPEHDGLIVPGGSLSNMYSMILARDRAEPDARNVGNSGKLVAFCSEQSHYSYRKAALVMGIGMDNMVKVKCDETGAMIAAELEKEVEAAKARGMTPFYAGTTAGSTVLGAFDDYHGAADVCERHGMWMHVDGAWGGAAALSADKRARYLDGFERADSFCWNPHKMLGLPLQCSIFVTKHEGALAKANGVQADYLFQPDKNNAGADLGDRTIQCGRKADALKIWLAWKYRGDDGFSDLVDRAFGLADAVERDVRARQEHDGSFVLAAEAQCANVGFWYVPPRLRPFDPATASANELTEIGFVAPKLKDRMQRAGDAMIGFQPIDSMNKPNFFRLVLPNPRHLSKDMLRDMLDRMDELGKDL